MLKTTDKTSWEIHYNEFTKNPFDDSFCYYVMRGADSTRIDQIVRFAVNHLPLGDIAEGPAEEMGLGGKYKILRCLGFILQELGKYPGKGFALIETGLRSPVTRIRSLAINAFSKWETEDRPDGTVELLETAYIDEPNHDTKKAVKT